MNQTASPKLKKKKIFFAFRSSERTELQVHGFLVLVEPILAVKENAFREYELRCEISYPKKLKIL